MPTHPSHASPTDEEVRQRVSALQAMAVLDTPPEGYTLNARYKYSVPAPDDASADDIRHRATDRRRRGPA
jgi:hypothetical protein